MIIGNDKRKKTFDISLFAACGNKYVTLKFIPAIYFHRNHSRYKDHNNTVRQSKFSFTKHYFSAWSPQLSVHFCR